MITERKSLLSLLPKNNTNNLPSAVSLPGPECPHDHTAAHCFVRKHEQAFTLEVMLRCDQCGLPFLFENGQDTLTVPVKPWVKK